MHYLTIVLQLIQEQESLHQRLRRKRRLLTVAQQHATALKILHQAWMSELHRTRPNSHPAQIQAEAMELAVADLQWSEPDLPAASDEHLETDSTPPE